jgi:ribonuclease P protein component
MGRPVGRIVRSDDFERVLRTPPAGRSPHFALHYLGACPSAPKPPKRALPAELSTGEAPSFSPPVDDLPPDGLWLGAVVPKRHAKRSVTRNLVKRQIRGAVDRASTGLSGGLWVVRLRQRIDVNRFPSAASDALRTLLRAELDRLMDSAVARPPAAAARRP